MHEFNKKSHNEFKILYVSWIYNIFIGGIGTYINIIVLARLIHLLQMILSGSKIAKNHETTIWSQ